MKNNGKTSLGESRAIVGIAVILALSISFPAIYEKAFPASESPALSFEGIGVGLSSDDTPTPDKTPYTFSRYTSSQYKKNYVTSFSTHKKGDQDYNSARHTSQVIACAPFDPNLVVIDELIAMGVSRYVAGNLVKYRDSGAIFRKAEDMQKIYGMDSTLFTALSGCIQIHTTISVATQRMVNSVLDVNAAGIEEWKSLPGIGDVLATRIVNYRTHLGGFYTIEQVAETYGLPPETFQQVTSRLKISREPGKIDLNTTTVEILAAHPYITQRQAEAIVNFRTHHGNYQNVDDLMKIYSLNNDWLTRMTPYLSTGPVDETAEALAAR